MACNLCDALAIVGVLTLIYFAFKTYRFIKLNYYTDVDIKRYQRVGPWAIVTGASDGIGRSLATEIARRGMNVVLIARTKSKLDDVSADIAKRYPSVKTQTVVFDFATATPDAYADLAKQLKAFETGLLVNNVGVNYAYSMPFDVAPIEEDLRLVRVNCDAQLWMTKLVLPTMKEKRGGAIINLSSVSAKLDAPYLATYSGTKGFNLNFSQSLAAEVAEFNVDVMAVTPNFVVSNMTQGPSSRRPKESFIMVNSDTMARHTIAQLGSTRCTPGHRNHALLEAIIAWIPRQLIEGHLLTIQKKTFARGQRSQQKS